MREGTTLGVDAKASVATFGHIGKQACRCDTHLLTLAKAARSPPCTLPFPGRRSYSRIRRILLPMAEGISRYWFREC